ncbi:hypothetical protein [Nocardiopsis ansamitocini]|uniref:Uncharacterized protein n=1 Tax=Nocardiopsis ansamitocini TaxID=1670832 RepID=A0A9W6P3R1_9ACTN|nr:hypothetical protein [Nocardiopsis ansamitocini]GLU46522.1 hypothetical protein Nans01_08730 [Nocardiopsis ansamitocini]
MPEHSGNSHAPEAADVDWEALAPGSGEQIPRMLEEVAVADEDSHVIGDFELLLSFPGPYFTAAPGLAPVLARMAADPGVPGRFAALLCLHELLDTAPADHLPRRRDPLLWRDEMAWIAQVGADRAREHYRAWLAAAQDEQARRIAHTRLDALALERGPEILRAELAAHEALRPLLPGLFPLLEERGEFAGHRVADLAAWVLSWFGEDAGTLVGPLRRVCEPGTAAPLRSAVYALGRVARPDDVATARHLVLLLDATDDADFAAALALGCMRGAEIPDKALRVIGTRLPTEDARLWRGWPSFADSSAEELGWLALSGMGPALDKARIAACTDFFARNWDVEPAAESLLAAVFGRPGATSWAPSPYSSLTDDQRTVLSAIAGLSAAKWDCAPGLHTLLEAHRLPAHRGELRVFTGAELPLRRGMVRFLFGRR